MSTFSIAIIATKGGVGKTTIARELAATAAKAGEDVVLFDIDPQGGAVRWSERRKAENPVTLPATVSRLQEAATAAKANGADLIIYDTAGKNEAASTAAAKLADLVLVPSGWQSDETDTLPTARQIVDAAVTNERPTPPPAFVLFNRLPPTGSRIAEELKAIIPDFCGLPACPVHLSQLTIYGEAPGEGKASCEIEPKGKAAAEIERLYLFVCDQRKKEKAHGKARRA